MKKFLLSLYMKNGAIVIAIVLAIIASVLVPNFSNINNLQTLLKQWATPVLICVAINFLIVTGGIDLSAGYLCGLVSISCGLMLMVYELPVSVCLLISILIGSLFGLFNGCVICYLQIPPFITTLGSGYIAYGLAQIISGSRSINHLPDAFMSLGNTRVIGTLPTMVFFSAAIVALGWFFMSRTTYGRKLEYIGNNEKACLLGGINVNRIKCISYVQSGLLAALAGIFLTMRTGSAAPTLGGAGMPFEAVTACVLGGSALAGGFSPIIGGAFGVLILKITENCINLLNIETYIYDALLAIVVFMAIVAEVLKSRKLQTK